MTVLKLADYFKPPKHDIVVEYCPGRCSTTIPCDSLDVAVTLAYY